MHIQIKNFLLLALSPLTLVALPTAKAQSITQVMSGLDNPRHSRLARRARSTSPKRAEAVRGRACSYGEPLNAPDRPARSRAFGREFRLV